MNDKECTSSEQITSQESTKKKSIVDFCKYCNEWYFGKEQEQDWIICKGKCQRYFYERCAEVSGVFDDDNTFLCEDCL